MCGIYAFLKSSSLTVSLEEREQVAKYLRHRGPDSWGHWENETLLMLQTRLKIVDLEDRANQPFRSADGRYVLIYNGECYNHRALRQALQAKGHHFRTESDTEVILMAFLEWGEGFVQRLAGMFAIVLHDQQSKLTYVWRDSLGIKPLYHADTAEGSLISSEIKPLLQRLKPALNSEALWSYFNLRYVAGNKTLFAGIHEVPPGAAWIFKEAEIVKQEYFWDLRSIKPEKGHAQEAASELLPLLRQIVSEHNIADVEVGCFLSGGVDSASLAALSVEAGFHPRTFTLSTELQNDEVFKAARIAQDLQLNNAPVKVGDHAFDLYRKAIWHLEDPIGDSIIVPTLLLAAGAGRELKVVLSGEGADEIFSGYVHHQVLTLEDKFLRAIPKPLWNGLDKIAGLIPLSVIEALFPYPAKLGRSGWEQVRQHLRNLHSPHQRYMNLIGLFNSEESSLFKTPLMPDAELGMYWDSMEGLSFADRIKRHDLHFWARNYTLHRLDRLTMAHSLEARVPFFDHRLVEAILRIPADEIYNFRDPKRFFRQGLEATSLSREVVKRKKQAFYLPAEKIFSESTLRRAQEEILDHADRRGIFRKDQLEKMLYRKAPELLDAKKFQVLYHFELWCQLFLDGKWQTEVGTGDP